MHLSDERGTEPFGLRRPKGIARDVSAAFRFAFRECLGGVHGNFHFGSYGQLFDGYFALHRRELGIVCGGQVRIVFQNIRFQ